MAEKWDDELPVSDLFMAEPPVWQQELIVKHLGGLAEALLLTLSSVVGREVTDLSELTRDELEQCVLALFVSEVIDWDAVGAEMLNELARAGEITELFETVVLKGRK